MVEEARQLSGVSLIRALILSQRWWSNHLPRAPPPNIITLLIAFQYRIWGDTNIQPIAECHPHINREEEREREREREELAGTIVVSL